MDSNRLTRRSVIRNTSLLAGAWVLGGCSTAPKTAPQTTPTQGQPTAKVAGAIDIDKIETVCTKGRINQSVSQWCFGKWSLDELCQVSKKLGLKAIDLLGPKDFATVKKYGLVVSMVNSTSLTDGLADKKFHDACLTKLRETIDATSEAV